MRRLSDEKFVTATIVGIGVIAYFGAKVVVPAITSIFLNASVPEDIKIFDKPSPQIIQPKPPS